VTGDPNQTIGIPGGLVVLNDSKPCRTEPLVVNALHAIVSGVADVAVAFRDSRPSGGSAKAVQASR